MTLSQQQLVVSSTTTVDFSIGWLCEPEQAARQLLDGDNDSDAPACAWPAARVTKPDAGRESGRVVAAPLPTAGALPELLVRPGRAQAPFFSVALQRTAASQA